MKGDGNDPSTTFAATEEAKYRQHAKEKGLENAYALGDDKFPATVMSAYNLLVNYRSVR